MSGALGLDLKLEQNEMMQSGSEDESVNMAMMYEMQAGVGLDLGLDSTLGLTLPVEEGDGKKTIKKRKVSGVKKPAEGKNSTFLTKLFGLLADPRWQDLIHWDLAGRQIIIEKPGELEIVVLPEVYKQSRFASFSRQLNIYGFGRKVSAKTAEKANASPEATVWSHNLLHRNSPIEDIINYKRRVPPRVYSRKDSKEHSPKGGTEIDVHVDSGFIPSDPLDLMLITPNGSYPSTPINTGLGGGEPVRNRRVSGARPRMMCFDESGRKASVSHHPYKSLPGKTPAGYGTGKRDSVGYGTLAPTSWPLHPSLGRNVGMPARYPGSVPNAIMIDKRVSFSTEGESEEYNQMPFYLPVSAPAGQVAFSMSQPFRTIEQGALNLGNGNDQNEISSDWTRTNRILSTMTAGTTAPLEYAFDQFDVSGNFPSEPRRDSDDYNLMDQSYNLEMVHSDPPPMARGMSDKTITPIRNQATTSMPIAAPIHVDYHSNHAAQTSEATQQGEYGMTPRPRTAESAKSARNSFSAMKRNRTLPDQTTFLMPSPPCFAVPATAPANLDGCFNSELINVNESNPSFSLGYTVTSPNFANNGTWISGGSPTVNNPTYNNSSYFPAARIRNTSTCFRPGSSGSTGFGMATSQANCRNSFAIDQSQFSWAPPPVESATPSPATILSELYKGKAPGGLPSPAIEGKQPYDQGHQGRTASYPSYFRRGLHSSFTDTISPVMENIQAILYEPQPEEMHHRRDTINPADTHLSPAPGNALFGQYTMTQDPERQQEQEPARPSTSQLRLNDLCGKGMIMTPGEASPLASEEESGHAEGGHSHVVNRKTEFCGMEAYVRMSDRSSESMR